MATLKEHQAAMVDLLANGSGIPASASRLAHAMHDVLTTLANWRVEPVMSLDEVLAANIKHYGGATTPGLNDRALSEREKALKTDSPAKWPTPAEQRVKELENTIRQLKGRVVELKRKIECQDVEINLLRTIKEPEQAGCHKPDTQVCGHDSWEDVAHGDKRCCDCGEIFR